MSPKRIVYASWSFLVLMLLVSAGQSHAQTTYATIVGTARDVTEAVVPGVAVTVTNDRTGEKHSKVTDGLGGYVFPDLFPGTYSIHAELQGFHGVDIRAITVQVNQTARYDLAMTVGAVTQTVEVVGSVPLLAPDTSSVGQVISNEKVQDLPLNGRNFMQLATLANGVHIFTPVGQVESGGPNIVSMGGRMHQDSYLIDGIETRLSREGGYGINLSLDAIQEFKMQQNSFEAEYGRGVSIVNAVIKSGGNLMHGTLFEFLRNDVLDARNTFDYAAKPPLRFNQYGANLGGPIKRDKAFYFVNYEGQRIRRSATGYTYVPTAAMWTGDLSGMAVATDPLTAQPFPNNQVPTSRFLQYAKAAETYFPAPNSTAIPENNYVKVMTNPVDMNQVTAKMDYNSGAKDRLYGQFTFLLL